MRVFAFLLVLGTAGCNPPPAPPPRAAPEPAPEPAPAPTPEPEPIPELPRAGDLAYLEIIVGDAQPEDELPMLIAIHGRGDAPRPFSGLLHGLPGPARVILPRAPESEGGGWSWFAQAARDPDVEGLSESIANAARHISETTRILAAERPTKGEPIVTGFSQGGMLTFALAVHHGSEFAAAFPIGGWLPPPLWPDKGAVEPDALAPIVALHGDADPALLIEPTRESVAHLKALGASVELHEYPEIGHSIPPPMHRELHELLQAAIEEVNQEVRGDE